jgi:hypothetical protein
MKMIKTLGLTLAAAGLMTFTAQAVQIVGSIGFTGLYSQNGGTPGLLNTATSMDIDTVVVGFADGHLTGAGAPVSFLTPIAVNVGANALAGSQLWSVTVGANTFTLVVSTSVQTFTSADQLNLSGTGVLSDGAGPLDNTPGQWQLGFGRTGNAFTWQSTSASVPEGGTTLILLGSALIGLLGIARKSIA